MRRIFILLIIVALVYGHISCGTGSSDSTKHFKRKNFTRIELTEREKKILEFCRKYIEKRGDKIIDAVGDEDSLYMLIVTKCNYVFPEFFVWKKNFDEKGKPIVSIEKLKEMELTYPCVLDIKVATNISILTQYKIKDLPKIEVPIYIRKVSNKPNTNIFVATIGYDHGGEFPIFRKANFYVYEIIDGKAKKVYEDLRCGDGLLKNGLNIEHDKKERVVVYLFVELGNTWDIIKYILKSSKKVKRIVCKDDGSYKIDGEDVYELKKRFGAKDINP